MRKMLTCFLLTTGAWLAACGGPPDLDFPTPGDVGQPEGIGHVEAEATAAPPALYEDALGSGWQDWSWATRNLTATSPVASGSRAISVNFGPSTGLYFHHAGVSTAGMEALEFQVHGGATTNPALTIYATRSNQAGPKISVNPYCDGGTIKAGAWTRCRVPLSAVGAVSGTLDGVVIQEGANKTLPVMGFDSIRLVASTTTPPPTQGVTVTVSPTSAALTTRGTRTFTATVTGNTNTAVTWSVQEGSAGGTITSAGAYTAPSAAGTYHVIATSKADTTKKATATVTVTAPAPGGGSQWVSGYYTGWNADLYPPEKVDFSAMTHIIVGRVTPKADGTLNTAFDNSNGPQMARTLSTRAHAAGRKAIIMVGGAGEHAGWVGAASSANRAKFVQNLLGAMDSFGYDGLDLDWEPVEEADKPNLLALVQALRAARPGMLITFPIGWLNKNLEPNGDTWFAKLVPYVDQINIMSYEMIGVWDGWTSWHTSALTGESGTHPTSIAASLEGWVRAGIPASKLGMGIPFYGLAWRNITGPNQAFTNWSDYVGGDNSFTYKKISKFAPSGTYRWDATAQASYLTFTTPVEDGTVRWISYDSPEAIAAKGAYSRSKGYGGTIIWTLNQGCTDPVTGANPLLDAVKSAFLQ